MNSFLVVVANLQTTDTFIIANKNKKKRWFYPPQWKVNHKPTYSL